MTRTSNEIADLIDNLERSAFDDLKAAYELDTAQLYGHQSYKDLMVANLHPSIKERIAIPSARPAVAARQIEGILRTSLSFHVEPPPDKREHNRSPAKQRADKAELFYAYLWSCLDDNGRLSSDTRRYQAVAPFCPWWMSYAPFRLPKGSDEEQEAYRQAYWPFKVEVCDPRTVCFMAKDGVNSTYAARHFSLPYMSIVKNYADADDSNALEILNTRFPWLRADRGHDWDRRDLFTKTAEVWILDDLNTCCHAIEIETGPDGRQRFEQLTEDYPNPWGESPLVLVLGGYNVDADHLEDRYTSLIKETLREQKILDTLDAHYSSIKLNPPKAVEQLPEEVAARLVGEERDREILFSDAGITSIDGTLAVLDFPIDASFMKFRDNRLADRDAALPPPFLTNPDQGVIKYGDVTAQLSAVETSNRLYDAARESFIAAVSGVCRRAKYFINYGCKDFNLRGAPRQEKVSFTASGKIPASMPASDYLGKRYDIGPDDLNDDDTLEISIVATSQAQKQIEFTAAHQRRELGYGTWEDVAATQTEDVTSLKMRVEEEQRFQTQAPMIDNLQLLSDLAAIVAEGGPDLSQLYLQGMGAQPDGGGGGQGSPPKDANPVNVQTTTAPPTDSGTGMMATG